MNVYTPADFNIGLGIPGTPLYVEIKDWVSLTATKQTPRFTITKGVLGEPFLEMSTDSSRTFALAMLQSSPDVEDLQNLFLAQLTGFVGVPFSILDNGLKITPTSQNHQKSVYPVGIILDERQESFSAIGATWTYPIGVVSGATVFF